MTGQILAEHVKKNNGSRSVMKGEVGLQTLVQQRNVLAGHTSVNFKDPEDD